MITRGLSHRCRRTPLHLFSGTQRFVQIYQWIQRLDPAFSERGITYGCVVRAGSEPAHTRLIHHSHNQRNSHELNSFIRSPFVDGHPPRGQSIWFQNSGWKSMSMIKCFAPTVINGMNFHGVFYTFISCSCGIRSFVINSLTATPHAGKAFDFRIPGSKQCP
jgi:hypothetical protein